MPLSPELPARVGRSVGERGCAAETAPGTAACARRRSSPPAYPRQFRRNRGTVASSAADGSLRRPLACTLRRLRFSRNAAPRRRSRLAFCTPSDDGSWRKPTPLRGSRKAHWWAAPGVDARLRPLRPCGKERRTRGRTRRDDFRQPPRRCRSSVVEHPLGKGEVVSSILTGSTTTWMNWQFHRARCIGTCTRDNWWLAGFQIRAVLLARSSPPAQFSTSKWPARNETMLAMRGQVLTLGPYQIAELGEICAARLRHQVRLMPAKEVKAYVLRQAQQE